MGKTICYLCLADVAVRARQWDPGAALPLPFREHRQVGMCPGKQRFYNGAFTELSARAASG